jgi:uncharacterized protein (DUF1697 family)
VGVTYVALLRGVNIGGRQIAMADLRRSLEAAGLRDVRTYLQSGNAVFGAEEGDPASLATAIRARVAEDLGHDVEVLVLGCNDMTRIASTDPFPAAHGLDRRWLHATFLLRAPSAGEFERLTLPAAEGERAALVDGVVYLYLPHGYGRSKLSNGYFERVLGTPATTRNWRTVQALASLCLTPSRRD